MKNDDRNNKMTLREAIEYCDGSPGLILTLVVLVAFVTGMWGLYAVWGISQVITTVAKG